MTRKRIFEIIEKSKPGDTASAAFDWFIIVLITVNITAVIAASFTDIEKGYSFALSSFEYFSITVFTAEYILR
ncbi:MAG: ion transporter, partial [Spirochaetia bacterium]|nr:ion transporter [Spirochaetia bacterium]